MGFVKDRPGRMGLLTVPQGARLYRRSSGGRTFERALHEFDVLAMPTSAGPESRGVEDAYSFKMRNEFWFVLMADVEIE